MKYITLLLLLLLSCEKDLTREMMTIIPTGQFTDERDGIEYGYIELGNQTWMTENLAYIDYDYYPDSIDFTVIHEKPIVPLFYDNGNYGVLYNWYAAIDAAPKGWHLPSGAEWDRLIKYVGGDSVAGMKLKDINGFAALAGGMKSDEFPNHTQGQTGAWWGNGLSGEQWEQRIHMKGHFFTRVMSFPTCLERIFMLHPSD